MQIRKIDFVILSDKLCQKCICKRSLIFPYRIQYHKLDYKLSTKTPVRNGFVFAGWVKNPGDTVSITKDYVTGDTTYYALWVKGVNYEFIGETLPSMGQFAANGTYDKENGVYYCSATSGTDPQIAFSGKGLPGNKYSVIVGYYHIFYH